MASEFPVSLDHLISYVKVLHPDGGPLEHLGDSVIVAERLDEQSDALIGHFVDQARASGASWSQIGASMGVSKQAAQQRFVARDDLVPEGKLFSRFTPRAWIALAAAGQLAAIDGADAVHPGHLAAGLLAVPDGIAEKAVHRLGVTDEQFYAAVGIGPAPGGADPDPVVLRELHFSDGSKVVLRGSAEGGAAPRSQLHRHRTPLARCRRGRRRRCPTPHRDRARPRAHRSRTRRRARGAAARTRTRRRLSAQEGQDDEPWPSLLTWRRDWDLNPG